MRLSHLKLQGYKSFATKTEFEFPTGITAIVGPNGSGKSNIADAIRWALGERSMTTLRAKSTADMIFAGGRGRAQVGMAEVSLTFDNTDGGLPIEFSEVTITRRAYRSGESKYLINGSQVLLRDITELLAESGLGERTYTVIGQGLVDTALSLRTEERRTLFEEAAGISLYRDRREKTIERLDETEHNLERVHDIISEITPRLKRLRRETERVEEHRRLTAHLERLQRTWYGYRWGCQQAELDRAWEKASNLEAKLEARRQEASKMSERLARLRRREGELRIQLRDWYRESADLHDRTDAAQRELAVSEERKRLLKARLEELLDEIEPLQAQKEEQAELTAEIQGQVEKLERKLAERRERLARLEREWEAVQGRAQEPDQERLRVEQDLRAHRAQIERLGRALRDAREEKARLAGEQEALKRLHGVYDIGVRALLQADLDGVIGPLAALIQVPPEWERAVEAALGGDLQAIVVEQTSIVEKVRRVLESAGGRLTLLPLDGLRSVPPLPVGARRAADAVMCGEGVRPAVEAVLGAVALCDSLSEAQALLPDLPPGSRCVTPSGIVLRTDGALVVGQAGAGEVLPDPNKRGAKRLLADERARREIAAQLEEIRRRCREMEERRQAEVEQIAALEARLEKLDRQAALARKEEARVVQERLGKARTEVAVAEEAVGRQQAALKRERALLERLRSQVDARRRRAEELETERAALATQIEELRQEASRSEAELREMRERIQPAEEELDRLGGKQTVLEESVKRARSRVRDAEARHGRAELEVERRQDELHLLAQRIEEELGLVELELAESVTAQTPLPMRPLVSELPVVEELPEGLEGEMKFLKKRLRRLGGINPNAPDELAEVEERHRFLTEQVADLEAASAQLRQAVAELDDLMESAFQETFDAVTAQFSGMFTDLFGGGEARLELTEPGDLLSTGVDIVARPPGKRAQRLALLSGGERALTAAALLFSLLHVSPPPFCVFDEVDAMLDEANVGRFRVQLEDLAQRIQFIIITHNRGTIESADTIYGVSMGSNAVSRVVSLKMDQPSAVSS